MLFPDSEISCVQQFVQYRDHGLTNTSEFVALSYVWSRAPTLRPLREWIILTDDIRDVIEILLSSGAHSRDENLNRRYGRSCSCKGHCKGTSLSEQTNDNRGVPTFNLSFYLGHKCSAQRCRIKEMNVNPKVLLNCALHVRTTEDLESIQT
jgi:hypothetical protein